MYFIVVLNLLHGGGLRRPDADCRSTLEAFDQS